ncbi:hypothetical protein CO610_10070 [Lysobacteraceae bacterium NML95-0200]|nr:hypothetical protein CO610_10070 [Xanthomonadaceae bacterium NML95-0200]
MPALRIKESATQWVWLSVLWRDTAGLLVGQLSLYLCLIFKRCHIVLCFYINTWTERIKMNGFIGVYQLHTALGNND